MEEKMTLKKAHKLTKTCLNPTNIEKVSVKHANAVIHHSTKDALIFYSALKPEWKGTGEFLSIILNMWDTMNVKNKTM